MFNLHTVVGDVFQPSTVFHATPYGASAPQPCREARNPKVGD
jgi:hypothetical protein